MKKPVKPLGLYIHIPFCKSKCIYCDFYSLPRAEDRMDRYVSALCRQLAEIAQWTTAHTVDSVYLGGGTPSYLGEKRLRPPPPGRRCGAGPACAAYRRPPTAPPGTAGSPRPGAGRGGPASPRRCPGWPPG